MTHASLGTPSSLAGSSLTCEFALPASGEEISARKLRSLVELVRVANRADSPQGLARTAATIIAECSGAEFNATSLLSDDRNRIEVELRRSGDNAEEQVAQRYSVLANDPAAMECRVMQGKQSRYIENLRAESFTANSLLLAAGASSAIVAPLMCENQALGTLAIFGRTPRKFTSDDLMLVDAAAQITATGIARFRASQLLERQKRMLETLTGSMDALMLVLSPEGKIHGLNRACCDCTGYDASELEGRSLWSALLLPEELSLVNNAFAKLQNGESPQRFEAFVLTRQGKRRRISWSFSRLAGDGQASQAALVGTGIDITAQHEANDRATRAELAMMELEASHPESGNRPSPPLDQGDQAIDQREVERRARRRHDYPYVQMVAPLTSHELPHEDRFQQVLCRDLSSCGFSYFTDETPTYKNIVVAFGKPSSMVYLTAEIRHTTRTYVDGQYLRIVGCRFTGRMDASQ